MLSAKVEHSGKRSWHQTMQNSRIAGDPGVQLRTPQTTRWKCQFYVFLAAKRGSAFALAAIPFHLLYHLYNGIAFGLGAGRHLWKKAGLIVERHGLAIRDDSPRF